MELHEHESLFVCSLVVGYFLVWLSHYQSLVRRLEVGILDELVDVISFLVFNNEKSLLCVLIRPCLAKNRLLRLLSLCCGYEK
jgi:hypothetical protein